MNLVIRKARPEDAAALLAMMKTIGGETDNLNCGPEGLPFTEAQERDYLASLQDSASAALFVAEKDGRLVGSASYSGMTGPRIRHRGEVGLSVLRAEWGQGIGGRLLEEVISFARGTARAEILSLEVRSDNARAIGLYKKHGFEKIGCFKGFFKIDGKHVDFDLMNLYL